MFLAEVESLAGDHDVIQTRRPVLSGLLSLENGDRLLSHLLSSEQTHITQVENILAFSLNFLYGKEKEISWLRFFPHFAMFLCDI